MWGLWGEAVLDLVPGAARPARGPSDRICLGQGLDCFPLCQLGFNETKIHRIPHIDVCGLVKALGGQVAPPLCSRVYALSLLCESIALLWPPFTSPSSSLCLAPSAFRTLRSRRSCWWWALPLRRRRPIPFAEPSIAAFSAALGSSATWDASLQPKAPALASPPPWTPKAPERELSSASPHPPPRHHPPPR